METEVLERVSDLENAIYEYVKQMTHANLVTSRNLDRLERQIEQSRRDMEADTRNLKKEMSDFKQEMREDRKSMNKQWGDLANKLGTLVEDIIAPAVRPVMEQYFKEEVTYRAVNVRKFDKARNLRGEFDVVATSASFLFLVETKVSPDRDNLLDFKRKTIPNFRQLFPEFDHLKLVPVFSSLRFEDDLAELATSEGIYLMAYREWEYMDILNFEQLNQQASNT